MGGVPEIVVSDARRAMGPAAARFFGDPTAELAVVGITGTNGKTTTAFLVRHLLEASRDFLVVGAYPPDCTYDECTDTRDRQKTVATIAKARKPKTDPVYGANGPLHRLWKR